MKLFGREAKTSDDKKVIKGAAGAIEDSRPKDQEREEAGCSKKDVVEGDRISMRTATTATPSESHRSSSSSKPVDLDDLYDNGNFDDTSDASVGDATETSISHSHSDSRAGGEAASAGQHEDNRMAALVHTMAEKQEGISDAFYHMIKKLTKSVQQMEQQDNAAADEKAKSKAKRHVEKALEMQETAKTMATKQTRIAQQFVALVHRLEHESAELAAENQGLRRQLQTARVILKDEAGVELEDVSMTQHSHATPTQKSGARNNHPQTPRSSSGSHNNKKSKRPPLTQHHSRSSRNAHSSPASTIHPIKEICFSNTVVDVTELMSTSALNNSSSEDAADPDVTATTPIKESISSDSPGATSESSPRTVANTDNLRFLL